MYIQYRVESDRTLGTFSSSAAEAIIDMQHQNDFGPEEIVSLVKRRKERDEPLECEVLYRGPAKFLTVDNGLTGNAFLEAVQAVKAERERDL